MPAFTDRSCRGFGSDLATMGWVPDLDCGQHALSSGVVRVPIGPKTGIETSSERSVVC